MKQMRSRFRLITLLLVCAFLVVLVLCTGSVLKTNGVTISSLSSLPAVSGTASPEPAADVETPPAGDVPSAPSVIPSDETVFPETDSTPNPEYNIFGL